jgi:hypothetical protein
MTGYGEETWYDTDDHTALHEAIEKDPVAARAAIDRRPALRRSVDNCAHCVTRLHVKGQAHPPEPPPRRDLLVRYSLEDLTGLLLPPLQLGPGHRLVAVYTEQASVLGAVIHCPPDEPADAHDIPM